LRESTASHYIVYKNKKVNISVSIGIAVFPTHGSSGDVLLQKADQALYKAKQKGKNRTEAYREE
jgi:diguanylate cyclase (GGDEF)-like protein